MDMFLGFIFLQHLLFCPPFWWAFFLPAIHSLYDWLAARAVEKTTIVHDCRAEARPTLLHSSVGPTSVGQVWPYDPHTF